MTYEQSLCFINVTLFTENYVSYVNFCVQDYDLNGDGIISPAEFRKVLQSQKVYSEEQMNFLVECADKDSDGRISYKEFRYSTYASSFLPFADN